VLEHVLGEAGHDVGDDLVGRLLARVVVGQDHDVRLRARASRRALAPRQGHRGLHN